jgi:hypothetical protein
MNAAWAALLVMLQAPDTAVRVDGFVQEVAVGPGDSTTLQVILAYPLILAGHRLRALSLPGGRGRWGRYLDRYVEAEGRIVPPAILDSARVREVSPPGQAHKEISPTFTEHAAVTLAVVPRRIVWRDTTGQATGVVAAAYYTIVNHGEVPLDFFSTNQEVLCIAVMRAGSAEAGWRDAWRPPPHGERTRMEMRAVVRYLAPLPERAAPIPGRYTVRVSPCAAPEYEVGTEFEVAERRPEEPSRRD